MTKALSGSAPRGRMTVAFIECDNDTLLAHIGRGNLMAISGLRVQRRETGVTLPVDCGYSVTVDLAPGDTYTVRRIFARKGKSWVKGERTSVYAEDVGATAYFASCFRSYTAEQWPTK